MVATLGARESSVRPSIEELSCPIEDVRRAVKAVGLCDGRGPAGVMGDMTFGAMGSPSDNPRIRRSLVGLVPAEPDAPRRKADLALAGRGRQAVSGHASPRLARPEDGRGPEWDRCDDIVQQLFAIGLAMQISRRLCGDRPELAARITGHMNDLQRMIQQIRSAVLDTPSVPPESCAD